MRDERMANDVVRDAVRKQRENGAPPAEKHGAGAFNVDMRTYTQGRPDRAPYHPLFNPMPAADPEWSAGRGDEEMMVSIFVWHPHYRVSLWDNPLFVVQLIEFVFAFVIMIIALLQVSDSWAMNNYIFTIVMSVVFGIVLMIHFMAIWYWARQPRFSHKHNNIVQAAFGFYIATFGVAIVLLGRWLDTLAGSCCGFAASQPDLTDLVSYNRFITAFAVILGLTFLLTVLIWMTLAAHYYPEGRYVPSFDNTHGTDIYIDEVDEPHEMQYLTTAPARAAGKNRSGRPGGGESRGVARAKEDASSVYPVAHGVSGAPPSVSGNTRAPRSQVPWTRGAT